MDNNVVARMYISTYNIIILKRSILRYNNDQSGWLVLNDQREESGSKRIAFSISQFRTNFSPWPFISIKFSRIALIDTSFHLSREDTTWTWTDHRPSRHRRTSSHLSSSLCFKTRSGRRVSFLRASPRIPHSSKIPASTVPRDIRRARSIAWTVVSGTKPATVHRTRGEDTRPTWIVTDPATRRRPTRGRVSRSIPRTTGV